MKNPIEQSEARRRAQEAKEYLIAQIVEEAQRENVELSEIERKMLYFTESEETLPDIYAVNDQFEQEYDDVEYEAKISSLLRNARKRVRKEAPDGEQRWWWAERDLRKEDHYLGVLIGQSHESPQSKSDFWAVMRWAGITMVLMSVGLYVDSKGWMPKWIENLPPWGWVLGVAVFIFIVVFFQYFTLRDVILFFKNPPRE